jgi:hypothetical protein
VTTVPTFFILNRAGEVVVTRVGDLPELFYDLCQADSCYGEQSGTGLVEVGT